MRPSGIPSKRSPRKALLLGHFEPLEARAMLAGTAVIDDGVLMIQGDAQANTIDVAIVGDAVNVTCDGTALESFDGLGTQFSTIKVDGGAGDDAITVHASDVTIQSGQEVRLAVNGAGGNDTITVDTQNVQVAAAGTPSDEPPAANAVEETEESAPAEEGGTLMLDLRGGLGNDAIDLAIHGLTANEGARWGAKIDGGLGDDLVSVLAENATVAGRASLRVSLGQGNDKLDATLNKLTVAETGLLSQAVDGGAGNDTFDFQTTGAVIDGTAKVSAKGGMGDDTLKVSTNDVTVNGKVDAHIRGDLGNDSMTVAGSAVTVNGTVRGKVDGGLGTDTLTDERAADAVTLGPDAVVDVKVTEGPQNAPKQGDKAPDMDKAADKLEHAYQSVRQRMAILRGRNA